MASTGRKRGPDEAGSDAQAPKCKYGKQCYRRDENHFQRYLHPEGSLNKSTEECSIVDRKKDLPSKTKPQQMATASGAARKLPTNPYSVYFNKVEGIEECFNEACLSIKDILNNRGRKFIKSAQFTYMVDIPWLVDQYPENEKSKPLLIVQGFTGRNKVPLLAEASRFDNVVLCEPKLPYPFGTHHTKMMLLLYEDGLKVVITTANLVETDWTKKTQSIWMSPMFPKCGSTTLPPSKDQGTNFGKDLVEYLTTYKLPSVDEWIEIINGHDLSGTRVYLVASVPGRYKTSNDGWGMDYGHLKLRRLLEKECSSSTVDKSWDVVCQMSSIGSLGNTPEAWLTGEFVDTLSGCDKGLSRPDYLKLVYPSVENIRHSLEGYMAGSSFPYSQRVSVSQPYLKRFLHRWKFDTRGRTLAMPHLKSYFRISRETKEVAWYLLTSANLSKAAWGCYELKKAQFFIRSYELGVLFVPRLYNDSATSKGILNDFPVSLDLPLEVYSPQDKPWIYDIDYTERADSHGRIWKIN